MRRLLILLLLAAIVSCDAPGAGGDDSEPDPRDPAGSFVIDPVWFRLSQVVAPEVGGVEDLQAWMTGQLDLTRSGDALTGSGRCTVRRRRHRAWLGETTDNSESLSFTAAGTIVDGAVVLTFQGCAWTMARYEGTFSDGRYDLRLTDALSGPAWSPDIWSDAVQLEGDDPRDLVLERR